MIEEQIPFIVIGALAAGLLIYGLLAGRMLSTWGWIERSKQPRLYWIGMVGPIAAIAASVLALTYF